MKHIEDNLRQGIADMTPDVLQKVLASTAPKLDHADWEPASDTKKNHRHFVRALSTVAACLFLFLGFNYYSLNLMADSTINLDVNPSIEFVTNKQDAILEVHALNEDGNLILDGMNLKNADINIGINAVIGSMVRQGFLTDINNSVLITVQSNDLIHAETLQKSLSGDVKATLNANQISGAIYNQHISKDDAASITDIALQYGISPGRAVFLKNLIAKDSTLSLEQLAPLSLEALAKIIQERNIDISEFAGYEYDESVIENVEEIIEEASEKQNATTPRQAPYNPDLRKNNTDDNNDDDDDINENNDVDSDNDNYDVDSNDDNYDDNGYTDYDNDVDDYDDDDNNDYDNGDDDGDDDYDNDDDNDNDDDDNDND